MLENTWKKRIEEADNLTVLELIRVSILGKSGELTKALKDLSLCSPDERRERGIKLNQLRDDIKEFIDHRRGILTEKEQNDSVMKEVLDITLPAAPFAVGKLHPLTCVQEEIHDFFRRLGFVLYDGPELEEEFYNFDGLNIPEHHPARQSHDTFYVGNKLLRTHTSTVEIRMLQKIKPPFRMLSMGRVYRHDAIDSTHTPMFHQVEGLVIESNLHMGHLKGLLVAFCKHFFKKDDIPIRFRPSFFPFTEPSAELDLAFEDGGWLEVLGCGMTHPNVLRQCGLDPAEHQGFAFGIGIERLLMLKYGISDIRALYENDPRWLDHYGSHPLEVFS